MNFAWYARRLSRMDAAEILARGREAAIKARWRRRQERPGAGGEYADDAAVSPSGLAFATPLASPDPAAAPEAARARLIEAADELLAGRWPVFDRVREDMAGDPDWFLDPRTGRRAPQERYAFDINHRRVEEVGTIKYVWETSRHHHLSLLAAAYFLTGDVRYAERAARHLGAWWRDNPFLSGVHWTSGIELGVRLIAWVWVRRLLDGWPGARGQFEENARFLRQLRRHQEYLAALPSPGSSANNHLIAEAAGQFAACCAFPWFAETRGWREAAGARLRRALADQTFPCGLNRELATGYHGFVLELAIAAGLEGEAAGHPLGLDYWQTARRMTDALAAVVDARLRPPRQGDDDDARALLLDAPDFDRWAALLATGEALFGACPWWPEAPRSDLRTVLWGALAPTPDIPGERPSRRPALLPEAGMAILRHRGGTHEETWCRCDHGPHGYLSIAAHAHADALSVEVRRGGVEVLADPGTYVYQGEPTWRSYFRSTVAHNCLELDGRDQSTMGGPFLWLGAARAELVDAFDLDEGSAGEWCARHDGYRRLRPPATHQRRVVLDRQSDRLVISDEIAGGGQHSCRLAFHLGPAIDCALSGARAELSWTDGEARGAATLLLPSALDWRAVRGREDPPAGWYAPSFGVKVPSTSLLGTGTLAAGETLVSELRFAPAPAAKPADRQRAAAI